MASTRQQITTIQRNSGSNFMKTLIGGNHQCSCGRERKKNGREGGEEEKKKEEWEKGRKDGWILETV